MSAVSQTPDGSTNVGRRSHGADLHSLPIDRVEPRGAEDAPRWAEALGVDPPELVREALRRQLDGWCRRAWQLRAAG